MKPGSRMIEIDGVLVEEIQSVYRKHGYKSISEFVRDSIRRRLEELKRATAIRNTIIDADSDAEIFEEVEEL